ncbi:MAG: ABC transporter ATP-binding protein [Verrucomicrobia bacterium]|nr:ABC transporter ATP-binding protein [Verrucomicrobiota bacterium]MDA1086539.1 ABC transporter ATP-binding protein [Verrucomicrobiota bacterium]
MDTLLEIEDLTVRFDTDEGTLTAVEGVSLSIGKGETLGLVGESGCGKSVTAMSILRLIPSPPGRIESGRIHFHDRDMLTIPDQDLREIRGKSISIIFQEPMTALSPLKRVGHQLIEAIQLHEDVPKSDAARRAVEWLGKVGIPDPAQRMQSYPFQLSGGMRQRVMIAMALMLEPELIIADEPTTALDVTVQAQVLELIKAMKRDETSLLLITHDMGVIWEMCERVTVMYASQVVETAALRDLFARPRHPYTEALIRSIPKLTGARGELETIDGQVPSPLAYPGGCRFRDRCCKAFERCELEMPPLYEADRVAARCFLSDPNQSVPPI